MSIFSIIWSIITELIPYWVVFCLNYSNFRQISRAEAFMETKKNRVLEQLANRYDSKLSDLSLFSSEVETFNTVDDSSERPRWQSHAETDKYFTASSIKDIVTLGSMVTYN